MVIHVFNTLAKADEVCAELNIKYSLEMIKKEVPYFNDHNVHKFGNKYCIKKVEGLTDHIGNEVEVSPNDIVKMCGT